MNKIFKVGLIGCGHISETYFRGHDYFNNFQIIKCADINTENAKKCAETYEIESCSVDELLNDSEIEIILNLTIPRAHYEIAKKSLDQSQDPAWCWAWPRPRCLWTQGTQPRWSCQG